MAPKNEFLKINFRKKMVHGNVFAHSFENEGKRMIYIPALNISGYGDTEEEAREMVNISIADFLDTLFSAGEAKAMDEIKSLGWTKDKFFPKRYHPPFVDKDGILKEFDLSEGTKIETMSMAVA